jgi:NADH-quinone oxidoreductase subunit N
VNTLIYTSVLGFGLMVLEVLKLRKWISPLLILGLSILFGINIHDWNQPGSFMGNMLEVSNFTVAFNALAIFITLLIVMLASEYYADEEHHISDYMAIMTFVLCGAQMMLGYTNLVMFFIGVETLSISLYALSGSKRFDIKSNEAGFKYFLMGSFASGFLLFGIALLYGATQSFDLNKIAEYASGDTLSPLFLTGVLLILFALFFKVSAAPFHFWAPDVYEGAPSIITAFMSTLVKVVGFAAFYKFLHVFAYLIPLKFEWLLVTVAILSLVTGNLSALAQENFKRLMAYSGISHAGYLLIGLIGATAFPSSSILYYGFGYALSTIGAFSIAMAVFKSTGSEDISAFNGLGKKNPVLAACLSATMLGLAGIPPFAGFFGKFYIFSEALQNGHFYLVLIGILSSMVGVYYYMKVVIAMYAKPANETKIEISLTNQLVMWLCLVLILITGIMPSLVTGLF